MTFDGFREYDSGELEEAGRAFCALAGRKKRLRNTRKWTKLVLDWFMDARGPGHVVWPATKGSRRGEFLLDQCHVSVARGRGDQEPWAEWYEHVLGRRMDMSLALESEWGKFGAKTHSLISVIDDAMKLAVVRAKAKVIVFASRDGETTADTIAKLDGLRQSFRPQPAWLCIDVPWEATKSGEWEPTSKVLPPLKAE